MQNYTERMRAGEHRWYELHKDLGNYYYNLASTTIILKDIFQYYTELF